MRDSGSENGRELYCMTRHYKHHRYDEEFSFLLFIFLHRDKRQNHHYSKGHYHEWLRDFVAR
jgi:hypothetical protein